MTSQQIAEIENKLQYVFSDKQLLITAFTHSSYANLERDKRNCSVENYERMAFFGDAILKMLITEYVYGAFPNKSKGEMSYMCSNLVSRDGLAPIVDNLDLAKFLRIISTPNAELSEHLCADLYEAVLCAIYCDGGYLAANSFVLNTLSPMLNSVKSSKQKDSKTLLQEYCQSCKPIRMLKYVLAKRIGADNNPTFIIDLYVDDKYECSGRGASKKSAERDAASKYLKTIS